MGRQSEIETYVSKNEFFHQALSKLKKGREIAMSLEDGTNFVMYASGDKAVVDFRAPKTADVCFHCTDSAINHILISDYGSVADFGIDVLKLVARGEMKIKILTGPIKLLMGGYIDIIRLGGGKFFSRLGQFGVKSPTDIVKLFKKLKRS